MAPRRKPLRWILAMALLTGAPTLWIGLLFLDAHRSLADHRRETRLFLKTFPPETTQRPAIFDPAEPGESWVLEMQGLDRIDDSLLGSQDFPSLHRVVFFGGVTFSLEGPDDVSRQVEAAEPHFELFRTALRRNQVIPRDPPGWVTNRLTQHATGILRHSAILHHGKGMDLAAFERLVLSIGLAQDVARLGDREHRSTLWETEARGALVAKEILAAHSLQAPELEMIARWLDRLTSARPPLSHTIAVDDAIERGLVVDPDFMAATSVSDGLRPTEPSWRELWSSTLHDAKRVSALARAAKVLEGIEALPSWERQNAARRKLEALDLRVCQPWEIPQDDLFLYDARTLTYRALLRLSVAVAWYESEHGAFPSAIESLVPRYLPSPLPCPSSGLPFHVESGRVWIDLPTPAPVIEGSWSEFSEKTVVWRIRTKDR